MESRSAAMTRFQKEVIPESLGELSDKSEYIEQVLKWAEANYVDASASSNKIEKKKEVKIQTKQYLTEILDLVATDIETNVCNLSEYLSVQSESLHQLGIEINLLSTRLELRKEKEAKDLFEKVMDYKSNKSGGASGIDSLQDDDKDGGGRTTSSSFVEDAKKNTSTLQNDDDELDDTIYDLLNNKHLVRIDDERNLQYSNGRECYVDDMGLGATVELEINPAYRSADSQYNALKLVESFEDDLQ